MFFTLFFLLVFQMLWHASRPFLMNESSLRGDSALLEKLQSCTPEVVRQYKCLGKIVSLSQLIVTGKLYDTQTDSLSVRINMSFKIRVYILKASPAYSTRSYVVCY